MHATRHADRCVRGRARGLDALGAGAGERDGRARQRGQDRSGTRLSRDVREPLLPRRKSRSAPIRQSRAPAGPRAARRTGRGRRTRRRRRRGPGATPDRATWYASPYKVFDNFYWLGTRQHSSWALRTSDGLIIIDTNFAWATEPEIINGLTTLGLDPQANQIRRHQPCARRSRSGRRRTAEAIWRQGRDGRGRLGLDAAAARDRRRRRADARRGRRSRQA